GGCAAAALAEWGSTTGQQRWPGAEGGQKWDSGFFRGFADRVSEPTTTPRHATPRHATPRHATPRRTVSVTICPHNAFHVHLHGLTSGREGAAPQALTLPTVSPKG
ncbi:TPA: hypothetical protein ACW0NO_004909, partial [Enterobacter ludwigii]|nr:hypothetical protein [Enterobacter asburiae]